MKRNMKISRTRKTRQLTRNTETEKPTNEINETRNTEHGRKRETKEPTSDCDIEKSMAWWNMGFSQVPSRLAWWNLRFSQGPSRLAWWNLRFRWFHHAWCDGTCVFHKFHHGRRRCFACCALLCRVTRIARFMRLQHKNKKRKPNSRHKN